MKRPQTMKKLKSLLILSFIGIGLYYNYILSIKILNFIILHLTDVNIITLKAEEGISTIFYLMSYFTIIFGSPLAFILGYFHIKDALYKKELKIVRRLPFLYILGIIGAFWGVILGLYVMLPFMIKYNEILGLDATITLSNLIKTLLFNSLMFFIIFLIPALIKNLVRFSIVKLETLKSKRKVIFFICLVISGIMSPVELFSMFIILIPLYMCFELGILFSNSVEIRQN